MRGKPTKKPFRYRHLGNLATIGRHAAVIEMGKVKLSGPIAWWLSGIAHIYFLIGVRQPLMVALSRFWSYLTFSKGARLITGLPPLHEVTARSPNFRNHAWQRNRIRRSRPRSPTTARR